FFAFIHSKRPHAPYVFSREFLQSAVEKKHLDANYKGPIEASSEKFYGGLYARPDFLSAMPGLVPEGLLFLNQVRPGNKEDRRRLEQLYALGVKLTDNFLGVIFAKLRENGLLDNTLVILTSDHGEQLFEHGSSHHTHLTFEETHVPLLFLLPSRELGNRKTL